jgi:hypothetical protein
MIDPSHLLAAKLSLAAYTVDEDQLRSEVNALGVTYARRFITNACVAFLAEDAAGMWLVFQGTRFSENTDPAEIWDDLDDSVVDFGPKGMVHAGFYNPIIDLWPEIAKEMGDVSIPVRLTGHSLGGVRAQLAMGLCADAGRNYSCVSFGAPAGASDTYWDRLALPARYVHARDFAPDWPPSWFFMKKWQQPMPMLWLFQDKMVKTDTRPGVNLSIPDHDINVYIKAIEPLTGA